MKRKWMIRIVLMMGGTLVAVLILEASLRLAGISYPYLYIPDPYTGYAPRPNAEAWWKKEGAAYLRINSVGFRDHEHAIQKPSGTLRIAVLGDSYTEALQVPIEQTYWSIVGQELQGCQALAGRQAEVINFGVSGYGTTQELLTLRHKVWSYSPDIVILAFLTGNDVRDNSRVLNDDPMRPYFAYKDGRLVLDETFRHSLTFYFQQMKFSYEAFERSRLLQVLREAKYILMARLRESTVRKIVAQEEGSEVALDAMVYLEPTEALWKDAWRVTEGVLALMRDEVKGNRADFLLVTLTNPDQVHPDLRHRQELASRLRVRDLLYPDRRIASWAERHGISVLNLVHPMADFAEKYQVFLHGLSNAAIGDGHWNADGHRLAGDLIARTICSMRPVL